MLTNELQLKQLPLFIPMADNHNMKYTEFLRASAYLSARVRVNSVHCIKREKQLSQGPCH